MAIISAELSQEGTGLSGSGVSAANARRTYNANYVVETDDASTSPKAVELYFKTTSSLPWYGRTWKWSGTTADKDTTAICNKFEVNYRPKSAGVFDVKVSFEPQDSESQRQQPNEDGDLSDDPEEWQETISISYTQLVVPAEKSIFRGFNPQAIVNPWLAAGDVRAPCDSALVPFDPPPEKIVPITVIRFGKWVAGIDQERPYQGTINNDRYTIDKQRKYLFVEIVQPFCGLIKNVGGHVEFINGDFWWKREVELWINPLTWIDEYVDKGFHTRIMPGDPKAGGGTYSSTDIELFEPTALKMLDVNGKSITAPTLLNGNGQPLKDPKNPVFLKWQNYDDKPHALFPW